MQKSNTALWIVGALIVVLVLFFFASSAKSVRTSNTTNLGTAGSWLTGFGNLFSGIGAGLGKSGLLNGGSSDSYDPGISRGEEGHTATA